MRDIEKTKEELMNELAELRHRITELEACEVERKRAEEEMHKVTRHLESVIDNANVLFDAIDREGNILLWNRATEVITGYSREEVVGHNKVWKWLYPDREYRRAIAAKAAAVVEGRLVEDMETTIRTKRGEDRTLSWYSRNLVDEKGNSVGAVWLGTDITERRKAEDALRDSEEFSSGLLNSSPNGVLVINSDTSIRYANAALEELTGFSSSELIGCKAPYPWWTEERLHRTRRDFQRAMGEGVRRVEELFQKKDGERFWVEISTTPIMRNGQVKYYVSNWVDITERKKAEDALRESEEFSSGLLANSRNPIVGVNPDTSITYVNPALEELTGFSRAELIGRKAPYPWWTEEALERMRGVFREAMLKGAEGVELPFQKKDGERFWVEISSTPVRHRGKLKYYLSNWVDITERKRVEKEIERARDDYLAVTNLTGDITVRVDRKGKCTFANDGACEFWGKPREELLGQELADYLHHDDAEKTSAAVREGMKTKQTVKGLVSRQKTPEGWRIVEWNGSPFFDEKGDYVGFQATGRDVTEGKRAEEQLRQSEEKLRSIVENAHDVIFQLSPSGIIQYVSPKVKEIYGSNPEDLVGKYLTKTTPRSEVPRALEAVKTVLSGKAIKNLEIDQLDGKGNIVPVEINLGPVEREGEIVAVQGVMRDITERKRAEERIGASLKEKEVLLQEIHHRVKNNLQVISSLLKLQSRKIGDERCAEMLNESQNRVKTMALIHEKLYQAEDLARIDLGGYIKSLMRGLFIAYGPEAGRIAPRIEVEDIRLGVNYAMPCGLVINELVSNSLKHAFPDGKKGEIRIVMRRIEGDEVELVVSDNGIGIPESLEFGNPESLGLRLVTMLVEDQLGGQVELDRTEGTRFQIRFGVVE